MSPTLERPYLGLPARLSQVWLNRWTLLFSLISIQLLSTASFLQSDIRNAQREALAACSALEQSASVVASLPHFMAQGFNTMTDKGIEASVSALAKTTNLILTGVEDLLLFVINSYKNTYLCLFTLAVRGSVVAVTTAADDTIKFLNSTLETIQKNILSEATAAENAIISDVEKIVGGVGSVFGLGNITIPPIELPSVSQLSTITIPDTVENSLNSLNNSMPTFAEVKNATDSAISFPFDLLKNTINNTFGEFSFNASLLPVPSKETIVFCSNDTKLNDFFVDLAAGVHRLLIIFAVLMLLAALIAMLPSAFLEWWSWRKMKRQAAVAEEVIRSSRNLDILELVQAVDSPLAYKISRMLTRSAKTDEHRILVRWFIAYITHPPALLLLAVSLAGFLACLFQLILVHQVRSATPVLVTDVADMEKLVTSKIQNATSFWVNGTNAHISDAESFVNDNLLGWARDSTQALNNTLNTFVNTTVTTIQSVFGNTPLAGPILDVLNCVLLMKVQGIQDGLTFVNENAKVQFPRVDNSTTSLENLSVVQSTDGTSLAAILDGVADKWLNSIRQQAIVAGVLFALYCLIVIIGYARMSCALKRAPRTIGNGNGFGSLTSTTAFVAVPSHKEFGLINPFEDGSYPSGPGPTPVAFSKR